MGSNTPKYPRFAEWMGARMETRNLTIGAISEATNETYESARRWVRGICLPNPRFQTFNTLARLLGVSATHLREVVETNGAERNAERLFNAIVNSPGSSDAQELLDLWITLPTAKSKEAMEEVRRLQAPLGRSNGSPPESADAQTA